MNYKVASLEIIRGSRDPVFFFFFSYSKHGVRLQVRAVRLLLVEQYVGFVGNDRSRWNRGHPAIIVLVPFCRVWMLTICCVMTGVCCARMVRDTV